MAYKYNLSKGWGRFCSTACSKKGNKNRLGKGFTEDAKSRISASLKKKYANGELISPLVTMGIIGQRGEKSPNWQGGKTLIGQNLRKDLSYKEWRAEVLEKDSYTCRECGKRGGKLQVHHMKPFAYFPELRLDITNGITVCIPCHRKIERWGIFKPKKQSHAI